MAAGTRVEIDAAALRRVTADVAMLGPELSLAGRRIAIAASATTPPGGRRTRRFDAQMTITPPRAASGRAVVYVGTSWPLAHLFEFGSLNTPPLRPLTRAAQASGLRFEEGPPP
ncbi:hypothetical protein AGRA3207_000173 [Actinomadura graeca]|uniref:Uncharacterized protein n=1 Tax=Actinomadura graeca TaxID=2750812 RepID=A0ABX8QLR2_9ACTN|nr:hypothetical protein [Actinomadura graeca]QXJ19611.1 hypothetical protein AGRA3207_000173 [Actinomadura graeca]